MRLAFFAFMAGWGSALALTPVAARAGDITEVLERSQAQRLASLAAAPEGPRAQALRSSFDTLRAALPNGLSVELRVVQGPVLAETLHGRVIVVHEQLGAMPEATRRFVIAHELGHVMAGHWQQMGLVYRRWVPGEVTPERTEPVAAALGREASELSHRHEYDADAFALRLLSSLGHPPQDAWDAFLRLGMTMDTATHPGTRTRLAAMRLQLAEERMAPPSGGNAE